MCGLFQQTSNLSPRHRKKSLWMLSFRTVRHRGEEGKRERRVFIYLIELKYQDHFIHCLDPSKTSIVLEEQANPKGHTNASLFSFFIQTRNWRGGPIREGGARFVASVTYLTGKAGMSLDFPKNQKKKKNYVLIYYFVDIPVTVTDNNNGTYRANFTPTKSGRYKFDLNLVAKKNFFIRVHGSPLEVTLITNQQGSQSYSESDLLFILYKDLQIDAKHTMVDKNLLRGKRVNDQVTVLIQAKDKSGNNILVGGGSFVAYINGPAGGNIIL